MILLTPFLTAAAFAAALGGGVLHPPERLLDADGVPLALTAPGYAAPAIRDLDGDGRGDLVLGLYANGAFSVRRSLGALRFAVARPLIQGEGTIVPGVW